MEERQESTKKVVIKMSTVKKQKNQNPELIKPNGDLYLEQLLPATDSRMFQLARMAMIRAVEIHFGSRPLVDHVSTDKEATIALREIAQGKITSKNIASKN